MAKKEKESSDPSKIKLQPLGDRVVVEREESETVTAGGIVLPDTAKDKPTRGKVVSVGDGRLLDNGKRSRLQVKVGRPRVVHLLRRRDVQARRPRTVADARRGHSGRDRVSRVRRRRLACDCRQARPSATRESAKQPRHTRRTIPWRK